MIRFNYTNIGITEWTCSELTVKTPEQRQWCFSAIVMADF